MPPHPMFCARFALQISAGGGCFGAAAALAPPPALPASWRVSSLCTKSLAMRCSCARRWTNAGSCGSSCQIEFASRAAGSFAQ
eukprot:734156-Prymnesium_polylepis.1